MKARTRIAVALAASLIVAGMLALAVHAAAYRETEYPTWSSYRDELLAEMDVSRDGVVRALEANPELIFDAPADDPSFANGMSIDEASDVVQQRAMDRVAARSRRWAAGAFVVVAALALVVGWWLAGRMLRPIRLITSRARAASGDDLSGRVALDGPDDEVKDLADTFDAMLDRIKGSFEAQRRFSAQVAHELRTPLAVCRSEIEMLLGDLDAGGAGRAGGAGAAGVRTRLERVAGATQRAERLVAQLHVLSRTDRGDLRREAFALDELVGNVVGRAVEADDWLRVRAELDLRPAPTIGDRALVESLVRNLVDNAGRHNRRGGWVTVAVRPGPAGTSAELEVANSSPGRDRAPGSPPGAANVGLTIVRAVLDAHDGTIEWRTRPGSVTALVRLPAAGDDPAPPDPASALVPA